MRWLYCPDIGCQLGGRRDCGGRRNCRRLRQQQDLVAVVLGGCGLVGRPWLGDKPVIGAALGLQRVADYGE
jgi:hypothetical protein